MRGFLLLTGRGRTPRGRTALAAAVVVIGGLRTARHDGVWADLAGGTAYAVLVVLLLALLRPKAAVARLAFVGLGICLLVELAQLTGVPAAVVEAVPPLRLVLGTTFWVWDLAAYAVGAALGALLLSALREGLPSDDVPSAGAPRGAPGPGRWPPPPRPGGRT